ncbi:hypothetical protein [uncultured Pseudoalteromonas sp.]|uniref:hypothetical protein n=1 Tax=uncultured Pseudoalteromonas sp. TaxID=114053 RepID=UPI0025E9689A|nr:hypothetical protein [uncultured Pseudoalteromonas sp.]|tara:strand:- start:50 stop:649 length:600 start_codon:yes stop_codon:yes gene_type:complete
MKRNDEQLDADLKAHFQKRKTQHSLSTEQLAQMQTPQVTRPKKQRFLKIQMASLFVALALFGFVMLEYNYRELTNIYAVDLSDYQWVEVHELDSKGSYVSNLKQQKQMLDTNYQQALANHQARTSFTGRLVSVDNDWYIADCEQNVLVQIKQSLLEELQKHGTLDTHIHQGDLLALDQNKQGQIVALKQLTHEAKNCEA